MVVCSEIRRYCQIIPKPRFIKNIAATKIIRLKAAIIFLGDILDANFTPKNTPGIEPINKNNTR